MRRFARQALLTAGAMIAGAAMVCAPAGAWFVYPPPDDPNALVVEVEKATGDVVPLRSLPKPFDTLLRGKQAERLSYRWRYGREAEGLAFVRVDAEGEGTIRFEFAARDKPGGRRYGAAVVLLDADGRAMHTFYARADQMQAIGGRSLLRHRVELSLARPPRWWRKVEALAFFQMTYHPEQRLDPRDTWRAMRRAVWHVTKGAGTEQRY